MWAAGRPLVVQFEIGLADGTAALLNVKSGATVEQAMAQAPGTTRAGGHGGHGSGGGTATSTSPGTMRTTSSIMLGTERAAMTSPVMSTTSATTSASLNGAVNSTSMNVGTSMTAQTSTTTDDVAGEEHGDGQD